MTPRPLPTQPLVPRWEVWRGRYEQGGRGKGGPAGASSKQRPHSCQPPTIPYTCSRLALVWVRLIEMTASGTDCVGGDCCVPLQEPPLADFCLVVMRVHAVDYVQLFDNVREAMRQDGDGQWLHERINP